MNYFFVYATFFVLGACFGSFINVVRYRFPRDISIISPRSFCPQCKTPIPFYLNIPIFSWFFLKGKCNFCKTKISFSYPLIEFFTASFFVFNTFFSNYFSSIYLLDLFYLNIFTTLLIIISLIDFDNMIIPNKLLIIGSCLGFFFNLIKYTFLGNQTFLYVFYKFIILSFLAFIFLEMLNLIISFFLKKDAFGFGDSKYLFMLSTWLGFYGVICTFVLSLYIGGVITIFLIISKKINSSGKIPFGPYLSIAAYVVSLLGPNNIVLFLKNFYKLA